VPLEIVVVVMIKEYFDKNRSTDLFYLLLPILKKRAILVFKTFIINSLPLKF
jgi:hypothetical protein